MEQKVVFITGASGGMGSVLSELFNRDGYSLALQSYTNDIVLPESDRVHHFKADLRDEVQIENLVTAVISKLGKVDVLINNAGVSKSAISWKTESETWRETMQINLDAPFFLAKHLIPGFRERGCS